MSLVVLVRPWTDASAGGGCCGGEVRDGVCLSNRHAEVDPVAGLVGETWRRLRAALPGVDVQVVDAANTAWLLPSTFRAVRRRAGWRAAVRAAARSTTAGAVLVDGERVGDLDELGPEGVVAAVRARIRRVPA